SRHIARRHAREPRAVAARIPVRRRDGRARRFALGGIVAKRADLLAHRLVALQPVGGSWHGAAIRDAVIDSGCEEDEVLHHAEVAPRLILGTGEAAQAERLLMVVPGAGADLAPHALEVDGPDPPWPTE